MKKVRCAADFVPPCEGDYEMYMRVALEQARLSALADEVPVGAVIVRNGEIIGRGHDRRIELTDPTAHAEVMAIREAAVCLNDWRLDDCALFVTLEPCAMCAGAILLARIPLVIFGATNPKFGAAGSIINLYEQPGWNHTVRTISGVLSQEAAALMREWFASRRR